MSTKGKWFLCKDKPDQIIYWSPLGDGPATIHRIHNDGPCAVKIRMAVPGEIYLDPGTDADITSGFIRVSLAGEPSCACAQPGGEHACGTYRLLCCEVSPQPWVCRASPARPNASQPIPQPQPQPGPTPGGPDDNPGASATTTPWPADPEGGIPLGESGGTLHRGTGEHPPGTTDLPNHNRPGMRGWVTRGRDPSACKKFQQFQFCRTLVFLVDAAGVETNIDATAGKFRNNNKYGSGTPARERFGHWESDDYPAAPGDHSHDKTVPMPGETDASGKPLMAGPYWGPGGPGAKATPEGSPIPGVNGAVGVVDAPQFAVPPFAFDALREHEKNKPLRPGEHRRAWPGYDREEKPPDAGPYTLKFRADFRDYIYCVDPAMKCLGYYEWHVSETVTFKVEYVDVRTPQEIYDLPKWRPGQHTIDYKYEGPTFDNVVQPCP